MDRPWCGNHGLFAFVVVVLLRSSISRIPRGVKHIFTFVQTVGAGHGSITTRYVEPVFPFRPGHRVMNLDEAI